MYDDESHPSGQPSGWSEAELRVGRAHGYIVGLIAQAEGRSITDHTPECDCAMHQEFMIGLGLGSTDMALTTVSPDSADGPEHPEQWQ